MHRDYMPRNLMVCEPNPGVLDFQDAVYGPITYDVASLFKDAFISWEEERVLDWTVRYWEKAKHAGLPVDADFGIFYVTLNGWGCSAISKCWEFSRGSITATARKPILKIPRDSVHYARAVAARYASLTPLLRLLDELEGKAPARAGYTF